MDLFNAMNRYRIGAPAPAVPGQPAAPAAPKPMAPLPQFQVQRDKVIQRSGADAQGQTDAMQRRLAASGMLNSGAALKQSQIIQDQAAKNRELALADVDAAEMGEDQRRQEVLDNRNFQSSESAMARKLQEDQFAKQMGLQDRQFSADREDQMRNVAASIANLKDDQLNKYNAFLGTKGIAGAPVLKPQTIPRTVNRRSGPL